MALCCTCSKYWKTKRESAGQTTEAVEEAERGVLVQQNPSAANYNAVANISVSTQGEHVYDYILDVAAVPVRDAGNTNSQAGMDESMAYERVQDPVDIPVDENTAHEEAQDPHIPVEENRAYAGFALGLDIPVDDNRAYKCAHSPDIPVCNNKLKANEHTHAQVPSIPVGDDRENSGNAQGTDVPVIMNADTEHRRKQEIPMNNNEAYEHHSETTVAALKTNQSYNYRQPLLARNIAYDDSLSVTVEIAQV